MILFVELCVGSEERKTGKDGLYQYKNTAQNTNVGTHRGMLLLIPFGFTRNLTIIYKYSSSSEISSSCRAEVTEAQAKAEWKSSRLLKTSASTQNIDDLEASETPESILLSPYLANNLETAPTELLSHHG